MIDDFREFSGSVGDQILFVPLYFHKEIRKVGWVLVLETRLQYGVPTILKKTEIGECMEY